MPVFAPSLADIGSGMWAPVTRHKELIVLSYHTVGAPGQHDPYDCVMRWNLVSRN